MRWVLIVLLVAALGDEASSCPIRPRNCLADRIASELGRPHLAVRDESLPVPWVGSFVPVRVGAITVVSRNLQLLIRLDDRRDYRLVDLDDGREISLKADLRYCGWNNVFIPDWPPTPGHDYAVRSDTGEDLAILRVEYRVEILDVDGPRDRWLWGIAGVSLLGGAFVLSRRRRLLIAV